ncbi:MAG: DEAD/DEAH box helicase [Betaproteobacteria bacterium]|nr:DEAD/DEAH box helicase [Betaproteobacteria bacterium]
MLIDNPAETYTRRNVEHWCAASELRKGIPYVRRVAELVITPRRITAEVQGTARLPYAVQIDFQRGYSGQWFPSMECSCPVGFGCKHAAATLLAALEARNDPDRLNPQVLAWVEALRDVGKAIKPKSRAKNEALFYLLQWDAQQQQVLVGFRKGRRDPDGAPARSASDWQNIERALLTAPSFTDASDTDALRLLWSQRPKGRDWAPIPITERAPETTLRALLATERAFLLRDHIPITLHEGAAREAHLIWRPDTANRLRATLDAGKPDLHIIPGAPAWYLDADAACIGPLICDIAPPVLRHLLCLPPLGRRDRTLVASAMRELLPQLPAPSEDAELRLREIGGTPQAILRLGTLPVWAVRHYRNYGNRYDIGAFDYALPRFRYGEIEVTPKDKREFVSLPSGETVRLRHDVDAEAAALARLIKAGLAPLPAQALEPRDARAQPEAAWGLASEEDWPTFVEHEVKTLAREGWSVTIPPGFRHRRLSVDAWHAEVEERGNGWFELDLGITVEGRRLALPPLLAELFARDPRWLDTQRLDRIDADETVDLHLPEGDMLRVGAERIKPLARTLIDLFDRKTDGPLRLPALDAQRLEIFSDPQRWQFHGPESLHALATRLRNAGQPQAANTPQGFALELRGYQREGLGWLQYLRENALAGILADDMGLGKTAQALAHLLIEKQAGRADRPSLIVLPTSLVFNWRREAALCTPALRVLALHGPNRAARFDEISAHDIVLTTYPLVWRDAEILQNHAWHFLILDEAQTVKNAASKAAGTLRTLNARHRLCITGTPLENHLGELWAQFDFLLPGFLGSQRDFAKHWRTPIEKHGDTLRRELLARRLKPFILRRRKEDVARELPPKTLVLRSVAFDTQQRDLYETVRATVDAAVQREIAAKGFHRSQIAILDALLKLRQVCCDPRLLAAQSAQRVKQSAKLELLMEMLPELIAEGRRILLFSQFTGMLDLIEAEVERAGLDFVRLDGGTREREIPVRRFQNGEAPLFLISLKAGGVGLNLTAADTVIHFDPWWNPAAENQATDRAHRIGQTRNVFVYKLIVAGSIEERILALQDKKARLAAEILNDAQNTAQQFSETDLAALLAPLPD